MIINRSHPEPDVPLRLVIDTNVLLDWLAFRHPFGDTLLQALRSGRWLWLSTQAMRDEMSHVIRRASLARWAIDEAQVWAAWDRYADLREPYALLGAHERLVCTDPDDQKFIDLAIGHRVEALLTRDRAVLRLAGRARRLGVSIATPEAWLAKLHVADAESSEREARSIGREP